MSPGFKFNEWELAGVPLRIEIGPKDLEKSQATIARRFDREKTPRPLDGVAAEIPGLLETAQREMLEAARTRLDEHTHLVGTGRISWPA